MYPPKLVKAIIEGFTDQLQHDRRTFIRHHGPSGPSPAPAWSLDLLCLDSGDLGDIDDPSADCDPAEDEPVPLAAVSPFRESDEEFNQEWQAEDDVKGGLLPAHLVRPPACASWSTLVVVRCTRIQLGPDAVGSLAALRLGCAG